MLMTATDSTVLSISRVHETDSKSEAIDLGPTTLETERGYFILLSIKPTKALSRLHNMMTSSNSLSRALGLGAWGLGPL